MSNESIPVELRSLLAELHFIAQFERGKKPCMSDMTFVSASGLYSYFGAYFRGRKGESRKTLLSSLENTVEKFINALKIYKNKNEYITLLVNLMAKCRVSIESSLITTYHDDPEMIGKIRVLLTNIDLQLKIYPHLIEGNPENHNDNNDNNNNEFDLSVERPERSERRRRRHRSRSKRVMESMESHE